MSCRVKSQAEKNYLKRIIQTMSGYIVLVMATTWLVRHGKVSGWALYVFALLPAIPVIRLIHVVALYLHEEKDEFQRLLVVQSILLGTVTVLVVATCSDFLRSYTKVGDLPPFTLFCVFWFAFALSQGVQTLRNRVGDDEPA